MAKDLAKAQKEFSALQKVASDLTELLGSLSTNRQHFEGMVYEASEDITRRVGELRKEGTEAKTLKDCSGDNQIKAILGEVENIKKKLTDVEAGFADITLRGNKVREQLIALQDEVQKEVDDRTKKKDRKVLAIDSKSLPGLEKLAKEIGETGTALQENVLLLIKAERYKAKLDKIDLQMETAVNKAPEEQGKRDEESMAKRGLDMRLVAKNTKEAQAKRNESKKNLGECLKFLKAGDKARAKDALDLASAARGELQAIAEQYATALKGINKYDMQTMKDSKDGKAILTAIDVINKLDEEAGKELDTILTKVKF